MDQSGWQETGEIQSWQLTVYEKTATPLWFGGGVVYQIFPDRFCRLSLPDPTGLVGNRWVLENWNDQPVWAPDSDGEVRNRDFFGGSLNGIIAKLDDLAALGVTVLYLNPIFECRKSDVFYHKIFIIRVRAVRFVKICLFDLVG